MHEDARDTIVDRYVNGRMSPAEEEEFLRMAGNDPQLRHLVRAERIVRGSALRSRESIARSAGDPPPALMARLAATAPGGTTPTAETATTPRTALFNGHITRALLAALGIGGIAVGTFIVAPLLESPKPAPRIERTVPRHDRGTADGAHAPGLTQPETSPARAPYEPPTSPAPPSPTQPQSTESALRQTERREQVDAIRNPSDTSTGHHPVATMPDQPARSEELPVIVRDSLQLHLKIDTSRR